MGWMMAVVMSMPVMMYSGSVCNSSVSVWDG